MTRKNQASTAEEYAFLAQEIDLLITQHRLEDFEEALAESVGLLTRMTNAGLIEGSREGILKGLGIIVRSCPEIDSSFRRFTLALSGRFQHEMKQMEKPN